MIPLNVFDTVATISQPIPCPGKLCSCSIWSIQVTELLVCHLKGVKPVSQWARPVRAFFWSPPPFWAAPQNLHHSCCGPDKWRESTHFFVLHPQLRQPSNTTTTDLVSMRVGGGGGEEPTQNIFGTKITILPLNNFSTLLGPLALSDPPFAVSW